MVNQIDVIPKSTDPAVDQPGAWRPVVAAVRGIFKAMVNCPSCNKVMTLKDYSITSDGVVTHRVICPLPNCDYNEHIILGDWDYGQIVDAMKSKAA